MMMDTKGLTGISWVTLKGAGGLGRGNAGAGLPFNAIILQAYTGKPYEVREVDCWANGDRVCRFNGPSKNKSAVSGYIIGFCC